MALEKIKKLRTIEFTFTDDAILPKCHCVFHEVIEEDGVEIAKNILREVHDAETVLTECNAKSIYVYPNS